MAKRDSDFTVPKTFISYSWDDGAHKEWVKQLAIRLRTDGVDVTLDRWDAVPGDQLPAFMERAVRASDFVIAVCTPRFKARADRRGGGVGYEGDIMTAEVFTSGNRRKFIPVLRRGVLEDAAPSWLLGSYYIDLSGDPYCESNYQDLLRTLHGAREEAPPLGQRPNFKDRTGSDATPAPAVVTPLKETSTPQHQSSVTPNREIQPSFDAVAWGDDNMPMRAVIAHVSDLHFGHHDEEVEGYLREDLLRGTKPDFIVVTGDLSELNLAPQFDKAKDFLRGVISGLSDENHPARIIVIPGNHDVSVFKGRRAWDEAFRDWNVGGTSGVCRPGRLADYHEIDCKGDRSAAERRAAADWSYCEYYPECQLAFLKFDSNRLAPALWNRLSPPWWYRNNARGRVGREQAAEMKRVLQRYDRAFPEGKNASAFKDARKVALVHHHIHYLPNVGSDSIFLMVDAGPFWRTMIDLGVELVLHGHKHYATHAVIRYMAQTKEAGREERELMVLSAGTATSKDRPNGNSYFCVEADMLSCRVQQRTKRDLRFEDDGPVIIFRRNVDISVPGSKDPIDGAALDAMLTPDESDYVYNLHIEDMVYAGTIDRNLGYRMEITFAGSLLRQETFLEVPMVVVNAPAHEHTLAPVVTNLLAGSNEIIEGVEVKRHGSNVRKLVIRIPLPTANPGDRFKIGLKVSAPAVMYDINDFDAVGLLRYRHGPTRFSYMLRSDRKFIGAQCFAVHRSGLRILKMPPGAPEFVDGLYVVRPMIDSVAALGAGVLCHYHKLLPMRPAPAPADNTV